MIRLEEGLAKLDKMWELALVPLPGRPPLTPEEVRKAKLRWESRLAYAMSLYAMYCLGGEHTYTAEHSDIAFERKAA